MTAPLEASQGVYDAMAALVAAVDECMEADPDCDILDAGLAPAQYGLLREDGISIVYEQRPPNELCFTLQVPMDTIIVALDALSRPEVETP